MEQSGVQSSQSRVEERVTGRPVQLELVEERGIEVHICHKVAVPKPRVDFEAKEDKEGGEWELDRPTTRAPDIRDRSAKAQKLLKEEVIAASFGRII